MERDYLENDMRSAGIKVVWAPLIMGKSTLAINVASQLLRRRFHLIHSQGFISAFHVSVVNWLFRIPHVMTMHGIFEEKYFRGKRGRLKRFLFAKAMKNVNIFHGVSNGIMEHFRKSFPDFEDDKARWVVINHGILPASFLEALPDAGKNLRSRLGLDDRKSIFGFFGRFMPEKGFGHIIDAAMILKDKGHVDSFVILAVGSGDYEREYKIEIEKKGVNRYFKFLPFDPDVAGIMKGCDAVLMPSVWEAWGLVACESLAAGVPLIASDCIGLQEAIEHTPAIRIPPQDASALAIAMEQVLANPDLKNTFQEFKQEAARRFDVRHSAAKLIELFKQIYDERLGSPPKDRLSRESVN